MRRVTSGLLQSVVAAACTTRRCVSETTRTDILKVWNAPSGASAAPQLAASVPKLSKALSFASSSQKSQQKSTVVSAPESAVGTSAAEVKWSHCERLDFFVNYYVPTAWSIAEHARENHVSIQCAPPTTPSAVGGNGNLKSPAALHGFTLNCFAYHRKVAEPNAERLMELFLKRFAPCVNNSVEVVKMSKPLPAPGSETAGKGSGDTFLTTSSEGRNAMDEHVVDRIASRFGGSVCEITFSPLDSKQKAHGLCRAFYASNRRFHYVVLMAVPEEEYLASSDLVAHAVMSVYETRSEAGGKNF